MTILVKKLNNQRIPIRLSHINEGFSFDMLI